jgi:peptidoglycan hydrolase CwlO-like protein
MLNLPILPKETSLVDKNGYASFSFQRYWQNFKSAITSQEESQERVIADLQAVQQQQAAQIADIQEALDAAQAAQSAANAAQQAAVAADSKAVAAQAKAEQVEVDAALAFAQVNDRLVILES